LKAKKQEIQAEITKLMATYKKTNAWETNQRIEELKTKKVARNRYCTIRAQLLFLIEKFNKKEN
jgi:hypothetical protein